MYLFVHVDEVNGYSCSGKAAHNTEVKPCTVRCGVIGAFTISSDHALELQIYPSRQIHEAGKLGYFIDIIKRRERELGWDGVE